MQVKEVTDKKTAGIFLRLPRILYRNDPNWICPLDNEIEAVFDEKRNSFFAHGICKRWILLDQQNNAVGRIAAFINHEKAFGNSLPTGGVGFFECINSPEAAHLLFATAQDWLAKHGMQAMDGMINFGENDKYWGLLVEGFKPPSMGMNYNPAYYKDLVESYGFTKLYDQYTNFLDATVDMPERFTKISDWVMKKQGYSFRHFDKKQFDRFANDFMEVYNDAWHDFDNFTPIQLPTIKESFRQMKPVMDEKIIWFAYYNDKPIAFILCLPDINQVLRHLKGKLDFLGKLKFLWYRRTTTINRLRIIVMGCKRKFQNHGIESALVRSLQQEVLPRGTIKGVELAWVADWNRKMLAIHEATGAVKDKVHRTYRCVFDIFPREEETNHSPARTTIPEKSSLL
jgi:hypothetical protein